MTVYVDDGGSNTSPYETLAKAATSLATGVAQLVAGEDLLVGSNTVEALGANTTYTFPGTAAARNRVISISTADETYLKASAAQVDGSAGGYDIIIGGHVNFYGVFLTIGDDFLMTVQESNIEFEDSNVELTGSGSLFRCGASNGGSYIKCKSTDIDFSNGGNGFGMTNSSYFEWVGGTLSFTGAQPSILFIGASLRDGFLSVRNVDLSVITGTLQTLTAVETYMAEFINCILNSGVTPFGTIGGPKSISKMLGTDDTTGNDLYRLHWATYYGSVVHDDAIYRTSGAASPASNNISWKMTSNANAVEYSEALVTHEIVIGWIASTGSKTFTCHVNIDQAANLQDDEIWLEIEYLDASADTQRAIANDRMADILATPADQAASTEGWAGTGGFTNENKFQLVVTQTVNRVGPAIARVYLAKPSVTVYVCPFVEIS